MRFHYYSFLREYGREPLNINDLFDGMAVATARSELEDHAWRRR